MAELEIKTSSFSCIRLESIDKDNEVGIHIEDSTSIYIKKEDSILIINHLKQQFGL